MAFARRIGAWYDLPMRHYRFRLSMLMVAVAILGVGFALVRAFPAVAVAILLVVLLMVPGLAFAWLYWMAVIFVTSLFAKGKSSDRLSPEDLSGASGGPPKDTGHDRAS